MGDAAESVEELDNARGVSPGGVIGEKLASGDTSSGFGSVISTSGPEDLARSRSRILLWFLSSMAESGAVNGTSPGSSTMLPPGLSLMSRPCHVR